MEQHKKEKGSVRREFIDQRTVVGQWRMYNKRLSSMFGISVAYVF
tara:strand:+ start:402 stop:536 length:135 start_codon:yes stop_codon:yes gene_type:complete